MGFSSVNTMPNALLIDHGCWSLESDWRQFFYLTGSLARGQTVNLIKKKRIQYVTLFGNWSEALSYHFVKLWWWKAFFPPECSAFTDKPPHTTHASLVLPPVVIGLIYCFKFDVDEVFCTIILTHLVRGSAGAYPNAYMVEQGIHSAQAFSYRTKNTIFTLTPTSRGSL